MDTVPVNIADRRRDMTSATALLPLFESTPRAFDVSALAIPAKSFTGDFYFVERSEDGLWFALGDVAGKGLNASVMMMMIQEELENAIDVARRGSGDPANAMWRLDRAMKGILPSNRFATAVIGRIDMNGTIVIANGGHCPPLLVHGGKAEAIDSTGPVIGMLDRPSWTTVVRNADAGDKLVLYTDGVTEAADAASTEFGTEKLTNVVTSTRGAVATTRAIACAVETHAGPERQDDLTVVAITLV
jgi:phosphoserine phosphatase RsbU/P